MPWESAEDGYIAKVLVPDGSELEVGVEVAIMVDTLEEVAAFKDYTVIISSLSFFLYAPK
jgi:pyruvate/2-oxoglutarate dehydrogenase complex dihydrolipoamide acyltransferase (E2) component